MAGLPLGASSPNPEPTTERPPLNPFQAEPIAEALAKVYAVAMLVSVAGRDVEVTYSSDLAMVILDYLDTARAELARLTEAEE